MTNREEQQAVADGLRKDYIDVRVLDDGTIAALGDLIYTRAIYMNCDATGYSYRFCFDERELATKRFAELKTVDDEPAGYIARR